MLDKFDFLIYNTKLHYNPIECPNSEKPSFCTGNKKILCKKYILTVSLLEKTAVEVNFTMRDERVSSAVSISVRIEKLTFLCVRGTRNYTFVC